MHNETVTWGGLTSQVVHNLTAGQKPSLAVVLCHGYGATGTDLVPLAQPVLDVFKAEDDQSVVLIFPAARLDLAGQGMPDGRAWWPVDLDRLINRRTPELLDQFRKVCPAGLRES